MSLYIKNHGNDLKTITTINDIFFTFKIWIISEKWLFIIVNDFKIITTINDNGFTLRIMYHL